MIRPFVTVTASSIDAWATTIYEDAAREARIMAEADGLAMLAVANEIINSELPERAGHRHKANTTHLANSLTYKVTQPHGRAFPVTVTLTTKPGVSAAKVAALEFGVTEPHEIAAGTRTPGVRYLRWGDDPGMLTKKYQKKVVWKPTGQIATGYHFMERARDAIVARRRRSG